MEECSSGGDARRPASAAMRRVDYDMHVDRCLKCRIGICRTAERLWREAVLAEVAESCIPPWYR